MTSDKMADELLRSTLERLDFNDAFCKAQIRGTIIALVISIPMLVYVIGLYAEWWS